MSTYLYYNGKLLDAATFGISAFSRAVHYGDGAFETLRAGGEIAFRLDDHIERLLSGLMVLRIPRPDHRQLREAVRDVLRANALAEAALKILVFRAGPPGPAPASADESCVLITAAAPDPETPHRCAAGVSARIVSIRRDESSPLSAVKSLNYLANIIARMEAADHADFEALLLNREGHLAEGAASNLFAVQDGRLITPPPSAGALSGITRRVVFEIATALSVACAEADMAPEDLQTADEAFLTNAGAGVMPLTAVDGRKIGTGSAGPMTLRLQAAYGEIFTRETEQLP